MSYGIKNGENKINHRVLGMANVTRGSRQFVLAMGLKDNFHRHFLHKFLHQQLKGSFPFILGDAVVHTKARLNLKSTESRNCGTAVNGIQSAKKKTM